MEHFCLINPLDDRYYIMKYSTFKEKIFIWDTMSYFLKHDSICSRSRQITGRDQYKCIDDKIICSNTNNQILYQSTDYEEFKSYIINFNSIINL